MSHSIISYLYPGLRIYRRRIAENIKNSLAHPDSKSQPFIKARSCFLQQASGKMGNENLYVAQKAAAEWSFLMAAIKNQEEVLRHNNIGMEISERDRIKVNARRVGLEAPKFFDETAF